MPDHRHLQSTQPPYVQLLLRDQDLSTDARVVAPSGFVFRTLQGRKCRTKSGLLGEFARVLEFPSYFGKNWDAFEECVTDLHWLPAPGYVLLVKDAEQALQGHEADYLTFIAVLQQAGRIWATEQDIRPAIPFHVLLAAPKGAKDTRTWDIPLYQR